MKRLGIIPTLVICFIIILTICDSVSSPSVLPPTTTTPTPPPKTAPTPPDSTIHRPAPAEEPVSKPIAKPGIRDILAGVDFSNIDQHALNTPESVTNSIDSLAMHLTKSAKNDLEKARAIFKWITQSISYDTESFFSGRYKSTDSKDVLVSRSSICHGYSNLFEEMGRAAGLEVVTISGWGKGYGYTAGDPIVGSTDHAWNAVKINDGWYFIECTWGAGFLNEGGQFVRRFRPHYFLTPPDQFIYDHLPEESEWQLLEVAIDKNEYADLPCVNSQFFECGLRTASHNTSVIKATKDIEIGLFSPTDTLLSVELEQAGQELTEELTFTQREDDDKYNIHVLFPDAGDYYLTVFAKNRGDEGPYWQALQYKVEVGEGSKGYAGFPMTYGTFIEKGAYLYGPKSSLLQSGSTQTFKVKVPGAEKVVVIMGEQWNDLIKQGEIFEGKVKIRAGRIVLAAKFPGSHDYYDYLLKYTGY